MMVALAGCKIQVALDTKVEADGSGTIGVRLAADKEIQGLMAQQADQGDLFGEFTKQIPADWQTDSGTDADGTKWVSASKAFENTTELDALLTGQAEGGLGGALAGDTFSVKQTSSLFMVTTTFDATWDAGKTLADAEAGISDAIPMDTLASVFQVENRLTLPGTIKDNNATKVEGNTLIWQPPLEGATKLHAESVAVKWGVVGGFIAGGALLIVVVVVVVALLLIRRRRAAVGAPSPDAPVASPAPQAALTSDALPDGPVEAAEGERPGPFPKTADVPPDALG